MGDTTVLAQGAGLKCLMSLHTANIHKLYYRRQEQTTIVL